jgi:hypothetical protein
MPDWTTTYRTLHPTRKWHLTCIKDLCYLTGSRIQPRTDHRDLQARPLCRHSVVACRTITPYVILRDIEMLLRLPAARLISRGGLPLSHIEFRVVLLPIWPAQSHLRYLGCGLRKHDATNECSYVVGLSQFSVPLRCRIIFLRTGQPER